MNYVRLSELLLQFEVRHRSRFLTRYREAVKSGQLESVLLTDRFSSEFARRAGGTAERTLLDEGIRVTPAFDAWLQESRRSIVQPRLTPTEHIMVRYDDLVAGRVPEQTFQERARQNRKRLSKTRKKSQ